MRPEVSFHEAAEIEFNEAADYYDHESPGLGTAFIDEVERSLDRVLDNPESSPCALRSVRKRLLAKFPYSILYSVRTGEIRVLAIAHQRRRPFYWRGRK